MNRNRLYAVIGAACAAGYGWLFYSIINLGDSGTFSPCIFKAETGIPCPSCGSTRALMMFMRGDIAGSLMMNPLGILLGILMLVLPLWVIYDLILNKSTLFESYIRGEKTIKTKWVAILLIVLIAANWAWNIYKDV